MKRQLMCILVGAMLLTGCSKQPNDSPVISETPKETPTVEPTAEPTTVSTPISEAPVVPKPYEDTMFTVVDETAVSPTYKDRASPGTDELVDVNRFEDFIEVVSVEVGGDGYTHFVLKDTRRDSEVKFAVLTNLPDLELRITGGTKYESDQLDIYFVFNFSEEMQLKMHKGECSGEKYGLYYYTRQYAFLFGTEFTEMWIIEDYDSNEPIKGGKVSDTQGVYSLVTGDPMFGLIDQMLEGTDVSEEDKIGLRALKDLPPLVKFD